MALSPGSRLGPYEISELIGQGGMGEVYRATDTRLGRAVAIKVSAKEFSDRFEREARAISSLNHPNICTLYDVGPNYLVMELVEGETLSKLVKQGPLPLDKALTYAIQITDALAAAHTKGIVHRDLKPGNIVVTKNGIKVLDFGLAKLSASTLAGTSGASNAATLTEPITNPGAILGTLQYLSPEQAEGKEATERSDIFALGAVFYEMVTGKRAFQGETQAGILASILRDQPPPVSQAQPLAPRTVDRVIRKCLAKDPDDRWQSARDLKPALELIDLDASAASVSGSGTQLAMPARRRAWLWPAVSAVSIAAIAGAAWSLWPAADGGRVTRFEVPLPADARIDPLYFYVKVSPDGTKVAFTTAGQQGGIWVRDLEAVQSRLLPGTANAVAPFWSPDSRSLAYSEAAGRRLMRVDIAGGPPQVVTESAGTVGSGYWSDQGEIVFGSLAGAGIQRVAQGGGVPKPVTELAPGDVGHSLPSPLPDGRHFIYLRRRGPTEAENQLYIGSLDTPPEQQSSKPFSPIQFGATFVREGNTDGGNLFYLRDGTLMSQPFDTKKMELAGEATPVAQGVGFAGSSAHFSVTPSGLLAYRGGQERVGEQLTWLDRQGRTNGMIGEISGSVRFLRLSPDESQLALARVESSNADLWVIDLERNVETRVTFGQSLSGPFAWSPDGRHIAYRSPRGLQVKPSSGAGSEQVLLEGNEGLAPSSWSRDGRFVIGFRPANAEGKGTGAAGNTNLLFAVPMKGTARDGDLVLVRERSAQGALSPDGKWIAYTSTESGRPEVYVQPFRPSGGQNAGGESRWQISRNGGTGPRWRADGKEIYFVEPITSIGTALYGAEIAVAGDTLRPSAPAALFRLPLVRAQEWDVSRDGKRFLANLRPDEGGIAPITVVMNWQAALKK